MYPRFVSLDTKERNVMLDVLLSLRSMSLHGHPVHARLKSTLVSTTVDAVPIVPWTPLPTEVCDAPVKRKKKVRGKRKKGTTGTNRKGREAIPETKASPPTLGEENFPTLQDKTVEWETPPSLVEGSRHDRHSSNSTEPGDFTDRIGQDDDLDDDKDEPRSLKAMSDGASTATTTSSSLESVPKKTFPSAEYAAVLMGKSKGL
jgi:hypothetical protein